MKGMIRLKDILKGVKYSAKAGISALRVRGVTDDSRKVSKGDLFVAVKGHEADGYAFIGDAIKKGAAAVAAEKDFEAPAGVAKVILGPSRAALPAIADNLYGHPSKAMKMVGVTGTNGKTTVTYIIEKILRCAGKEAGVIGTINYRFKGRETPARNTTPGPLELQSVLAGMRDSGVDVCVMEVSSHSLDQRRVEPVLFDAAVFTNMTSDHLDYHKTARNYFAAKAKIFGRLRKGGVAILNLDDKKVAGLKGKIKGGALTYGLSPKADVRAAGMALSMRGSGFTLVTPEGSVGIETPLIGKHNISNILASAAAALALGIGLGAVKKGVETFGAVPGRLEPVDAGQPFKVFVDFAHTQDALHNILSLLRDVAKDMRIITVFGCGGNRDRSKRPLMGQVACSFSDRVIITSDNPRFEEPAEIIGEIERGIGDDFSNYDIVVDRRAAIRKALSLASEGSIVVIAGKGHEKYQIVKGKVLPFDDKQVARSILKEKV
ncbi:MAG: UDP-N-acetylmuramoyl-L-alanyl-D-glutamate--2,6-diaminopimelate ligase [Candidatus Omnitrophica bacterium]|nr:UDP-N-acetylmuramoyl-L-alanyl-D-glutamate--2,6-diaminopimelate ligase [Candidatus Omnitrophota bacterium]